MRNTVVACLLLLAASCGPTTETTQPAGANLTTWHTPVGDIHLRGIVRDPAAAATAPAQPLAALRASEG